MGLGELDLYSRTHADDKLYTHLYTWSAGAPTMASNKVSVAEARQHFARLIERARKGNPIEITRRGEPVAVLLSAAEYAAMTGERPSFVDATTRVRERLDVEALDIGEEDFDGLRDRSPGREIAL
ncbi:MAG: type II toxin-antitoxin system Phd/YefM family antitoxin [Spirochaetaceae bacterium]|nr:type II toxin-antitoxin system Phd/YefM family antitoxin [Spirochaetaceae bacterium]